MSKKEAWKEYMDASTALEREMIADMGQEAYDASQHWVNNELIKPLSKLGMYEDAIERERTKERERIIALLEPYPWRERGDFEALVALIKEENNE